MSYYVMTYYDDDARFSGLHFPGPDSRLPALVTWAALLLSLVLAVIVAATPIIYNTIHVTDTTFLAQIGRWMQEGAMPGVDFDHFYGGMHEWFVAQGLHLSGGTIKALDYALVLEFIVVALGLQIVAWRRLDALTTALLTLLCAVVLFARLPFESTALMERMEAAHSFAYNRLGTALTIIAAALLLVRSEEPRAEFVGAAVAGVAVFAAILTKSTFFPVALALLLGLAIMCRWRALIVALLAMIAYGLWTDPTGARSLGTLLYSMSSSDNAVGEPWLVQKAVRLALSQQVQLLIALALAGLLLLRDQSRETLVLLVVASGLTIAFWGTTVTMGPAGQIGHQSAPLLAALGLLLISRFRQLQCALPAWPLAAVLYAIFVIPHTLNIFATTAIGLTKAEHLAVTEGALAGYLVRGEWMDYRSDTKAPALPTSPMTLERIGANFAAGQRAAGNDYIAVLDAIRLVEDVPGLSELGLASDTRLGLSFATGTARVEGYPQWVRKNSAEMQDGLDPLANVHLLLISATDNKYTGRVRHHMGDDFTLCKQSPIWFLYVRKSDSNRLCPGT